MIVFSSLKEAISYKKECPFCNSLLQFDNRDFSNIYKPYDRNLLFNLLGDDLLVIDLDTEKLDLLLSKKLSVTDRKKLEEGFFCTLAYWLERSAKDFNDTLKRIRK